MSAIDGCRARIADARTPTMTLCGAKSGWDTRIPVSSARCRVCITALATGNT